MKHYLDLVRISAKKHKKENRMTKLCIVLAVFLVTVIFGMADMEMRSQLIQAVKSDGSWHAGFLADEEQGAFIQARPEVEQTARYGVVNYHLEDGYRIEGIETVICGLDKNLLEMFPDVNMIEGTFPEKADGAVLNETAKGRLGVQVGDMVTLVTPEGASMHYRITGITQDTALEAENDAFGMLLDIDGFRALYSKGNGAAQEEIYYVTFRSFCNIQKAVDDITSQLGLEESQVRQNTKVLALLFQSRDSYMMRFYFVAAVLAMLVVIAGIFMITASMNSSVARRTEFFGMLRCLGADRKQIIRFVRREALGWCRTAVPAGVLAGTVVVWILCGMLRFLSPGLFEGMPVFGVSIMGVSAGVIVGYITVLLAARAPAGRAARVSPLAAVSGNAGTVQTAKRAADTRFLKVDLALGLHHASGSKKNFFLVTGSFAFSIILFLAFSTAIDFMHHAINPLKPSAPDIYAYSEDISNVIPEELAEKIEEYPEVKRAFGRSCAELTFREENGESDYTVLSYDEQQFRWAEDSLIEGNMKDIIDGKGILAVFREGGTLKPGSRVTALTEEGECEVCAAGVIGDIPYNYSSGSSTDGREDTVICSEELFRKLTGEKDYAVLDIQLRPGTSDSKVQEIRRIIEESCGTGIAFSDKRIGNQEVKGASYSMAVFMYGFLAVIALIAFFNIINCIGMSAAGRMREYGAMRAVGMSVHQLIRMVSGETMTYIISGAAAGCAVGLPINWLLFQSLVTSRWGDAWELPLWELLVILAVMSCSVVFAVLGPAGQIKKMTVLDTISMR